MKANGHSQDGRWLTVEQSYKWIEEWRKMKVDCGGTARMVNDGLFKWYSKCSSLRLGEHCDKNLFWRGVKRDCTVKKGLYFFLLIILSR